MSMRMRKKRNFDARMQACGDLLLAKGANGILNMKEAAERFRALIDFSTAFGNDDPIELEIGCGKGKFACEYAKSHPEINLIALEKSGNVLVEACEKAAAENIENLRFIKSPALYSNSSEKASIFSVQTYAFSTYISSAYFR